MSLSHFNTFMDSMPQKDLGLKKEFNGLSLDYMMMASSPSRPRAPTTSDLSNVLDILDAADEILDEVVFTGQQDTNEMQVEPVPLGPQGACNLVENVSIAESGFLLQTDDIMHALNPLLSQQGSSKRQLSACQSQQSQLPAPKRRRSSHEMMPQQVMSFADAVSCAADTDEDRFRPYQSDQWKDRFQDLIQFQKKNGHCLVPHNFPENQQLAQWIKRQRYQYKLKQMNRHSTLTEERQTALENMGFVWDSHKAAWIERFESLKDFKAMHGHCSVPSNFTDRSLAIWVKCQRRQYKLYQQGARSTMTEERFVQLDRLGFAWNPRNLK